MVAAAWGPRWRAPRSQRAPEAGVAGHAVLQRRGSRRPAQPSAPPRARHRHRLAHARAPASANYRVPGLQAVHPRTGQARALRASPAVSSRTSLMFPRPGRSVDGCCTVPPRRACATQLAVGAKPGAQSSPCVRRGGPDGASGLGARGGYAHSSHFRSPMSRPVLPSRPRGQEGGGAGFGVRARAGTGLTEAGTRPGCGRGRGGG